MVGAMNVAPTIALYGATGYTGKLVAAELARRGVPMILAGRDPAKLDTAYARARAAGGDIVGVRVAGVDDPAALGRVLDGAGVVINAAGPFVHTGAPVLSAAIEAGAHYVDTTGEQTWIRATFERFGEQLETAGVAAVAGIGFDYLPGDLLCHLVGSAAEPLRELVVVYDVEGFEMTRGTMRSALEMLKGDDVVFAGGRWQAAPREVTRASVVLPAPIGRRSVARYPAGEPVMVPRHLHTRAVRSLITTRSVAPPGLEGAFALLAPGMTAALGADRLRAFLWEKIGELPEGPSEERRRAAAWTVACFARGEDGGEARGLVRGADVYGLTAVTTVHGALLLAGAGKRGALPPASAFDPLAFLEHLRAFGVSWELPGADAVR